MPGLEFLRQDLRISLVRDPKGNGIATISWGNVRRRVRVPAETLRGPSAVGAVLDALPLAQALKGWNKLGTPTANYPRLATKCISLDIPDPDLAELSWESGLGPRVRTPFTFASGRVIYSSPGAIMRVTPVRPRSDDAFTLPLRIVQVAPLTEHPIGVWVRALFGNQPETAVNAAIQVRAYPLTGFLEATETRPDFPTAAVLHFDAYPFPSTPERLLSSADTETMGTLGWLSRLCEAWRTRLVVIHCPTPGEARQARRLAAAFIARGGPAVLVGEFPNTTKAQQFYRAFYDRLVHDDPLDVNLHTSLATTPNTVADAKRMPTLFAGGGREEELRVSNVGEHLLTLGKSLAKPGPTFDLFQRRFTRQRGGEIFFGGRAKPAKRGKDPASLIRDMGSKIEELGTQWDSLAFETSERQGLLPLSKHLDELRAMAAMTGLPEPPGPRFVNARLNQESSEGVLQPLGQKGACLLLGENYQLSVKIGPEDILIRTEAGAAIMEDQFKWTNDLDGVWVEIGVTGLDFEVKGAPVQELWLPKTGSSDTVYFAVVPRVAGAAVLRFSLFYEQNVLQSFRLAAATRARTGAVLSASALRARLAELLDLPKGKTGGLGYLPRLEYSLGDPGEAAAATRGRPATVSLVANHVGGRRVVTVKGNDLFGAVVEESGDIDDQVQSVRETLDAIALPPIPKLDREKWIYGFGDPKNPNAGDDARIERALRELADAGSDLYFALISSADRKQLGVLLEPEQQVIQVAHVLVGDVIPWAGVYDRLYTTNQKTTPEGVPLENAACLASLPDAAEKMPLGPCGQLKECPLHPARLKERMKARGATVIEDTVACPRHFWGFKHLIELPPQQVVDTDEKVPAPRTSVLGKPKPVLLAGGFHTGLTFVGPHITELDTMAQNATIKSKWASKASDRDAVLKDLLNANLDVIYLYCHARGGFADPTVKKPFLEFLDAAKAPSKILPKELSAGGPWTHHPLIFLNGCGTVGFSPDALSPFIWAAVRDREASGVLGTEIPVAEELARGFALLFLKRFLAGETAGSALLAARRALLAVKNPLGLVYTLYAMSNLKLVQ